mgnify:CR=1 FL=1
MSDDGRNLSARTVLAGEFSEVAWIDGPRRGPAANRNTGAAAADGDVIIFLDDDCLPQPGLLVAYAQAFEATSLCAAEGRILADRPATRMDQVSPINENGGCFWSCNIALRRDFFEKTGGFDERFPAAAMEDVEFRERIRKMGTPIEFVSDALVLHPYRVMKGWKSLKQSAEAHAIYILFPECHLPLPSYSRATIEVLRNIIRNYLPKLVAHRGRGFLLKTLSLIHPFWCVRLMKNALRNGRRFGPLNHE